MQTNLDILKENDYLEEAVDSLELILKIALSSPEFINMPRYAQEETYSHCRYVIDRITAHTN